MKLGIWPTRYCPACGSRVRRAAGSSQARSMMFAGASDLVGVGVVVAAGAVGHFLGGTTGIFVGLAMGLALFIAVLAVIGWAEKEALVCECAACHRQFPYRECTTRSAP